MTAMSDGVALITGAGAGIGRATALAFARRGTRVVVADLNADGGLETVRLIAEVGGEAIFKQTDVAQAAEVAALLQRALDHFGRLDYAVNNAGIEGAQAPTADATEENWARVVAVNLTGVWLCLKHELAAMVPRGGGAIVNLSSVAGLVGFPNISAYVASKHGVIGLTRAAALEYARAGIRVNAVCPGVIRTEMIERYTSANPAALESLTASEPVGRLGTPEEVAAAIVWLCSPAASFVTGLAMPVDGGLTAQ